MKGGTLQTNTLFKCKLAICTQHGFIYRCVLTGGGALSFQTYSLQRLRVLSPSYTNSVLYLIGQVPPAALHHSGHQPRHRSWSCVPLSSGPVEEHVQHQGSQVVPGEKGMTYARHFRLATITYQRITKITFMNILYILIYNISSSQNTTRFYSLIGITSWP